MAYARSHTMTLLCAAKVRSRICVCGKEEFLEGFSGYLHADGYQGYQYFRDESLLLSRLPGV